MLKKYTTLIALALLLTPLFSAHLPAQAAEKTGTIQINVTNQDGEGIVGKWFLYHGISDQGLMVRNGTKSEVFEKTVGNYFLVTQTIKGYETREITSENPQFLEEGDTITFSVEYSDPPMFNVIGKPEPEVMVKEEPVKAPAEAPTPAPVVEPAEVEPIDPGHVADFNEAPFDITTKVVPAAAPASQPRFELATTGSSEMLALLFAVSLSTLLFFRKKLS